MTICDISLNPTFMKKNTGKILGGVFIHLSFWSNQTSWLLNSSFGSLKAHIKKAILSCSLKLLKSFSHFCQIFLNIYFAIGISANLFWERVFKLQREVCLKNRRYLLSPNAQTWTLLKLKMICDKQLLLKAKE